MAAIRPGQCCVVAGNANIGQVPGSNGLPDAGSLPLAEGGNSGCILVECRDVTEPRMRMSNIGAVLKAEITRLARREIRSQVDPTRKLAAQHRREIAALKRQVVTLERQVAMIMRKSSGARPDASAEVPAKPIRFSAKRLQSQRSRLGLSAVNFGKLLGVSAQTIYNWEHEAARPRGDQLGHLAALRGIGKREAGERLKQLAAANR
jgi:DNA-binding transcriptional regulator YiaG